MPGFSTTEGSHKSVSNRNELNASVTLLIIGIVALVLMLLAAIGSRSGGEINRPEWRGAQLNETQETFDIHTAAPAQ